jgi:hypothetical protein
MARTIHANAGELFIVEDITRSEASLTVLNLEHTISGLIRLARDT